MTELSYFHNGSVAGDAQYAPYYVSRFSGVMEAMYGNGAFVISEHFSDYYDLRVTHTAGRTVSVATGTAFIKGVYYNNGASETLTLDDNATALPRVDQVVIQVDWTAQTAELVIIKGTPASKPTLPTLQQEEGVIWEQPIATCFCPPGFVGFGDELIYDERLFVRGYPISRYAPAAFTKNIMHNSEFIPGAEMWKGTFGASTRYNSSSLDDYGRGSQLYVSIPVGGSFETEKRICGTAGVSAISFYMRTTAASVTPVYVSLDGGVSTEKIIYPGSDWRRYIIYNMETNLHLHFSHPTSSVSFHFAKPAISLDPYLASATRFVLPSLNPPTKKKEIILFKEREFRVSYPDSGIGEEEFDLFLGGFGLGDISAALVLLKYYNVASAAQDSTYSIVYPSQSGSTDIDAVRVETGRLTNSTVREDTGWVNTCMDNDGENSLIVYQGGFAGGHTNVYQTGIIT